MLELNKLYCMDCVEGMRQMDNGSVDMVLSDLPFEITENDWDKAILPVPMFKQLNRIIKSDGAIVLMSAGLYTAELILANKIYYRYSYVWKTKEKRNFLNANRMPLRQHIDIPVFYKLLPVYNPQKTHGHKPVNKYTKHSSDGSNYGKTTIGVSGGGQTDRYPTTIIDIPYRTITNRLHPTQKPVELMEWFIKTYTVPGQLVLDITAGSGTTAEACMQLQRNFIGFELNPEYISIAERRLSAVQLRMV